MGINGLDIFLFNSDKTSIADRPHLPKASAHSERYNFHLPCALFLVCPQTIIIIKANICIAEFHFTISPN